MAKATKDPQLYKVLVDGCSIHGGDMEWSLPDGDTPGEWHAVEGELERCRNGLHLTDNPSRRWQESAECYLVETEGPVLHEAAWGDEYLTRKVRLVRRLTWEELAKFGITMGRHGTTVRRSSPRSRTTTRPAGPSGAMQFVTAAWEYRCRATSHSWQTVNATMRDALALAINGGMPFAESDFAEIDRAMRGAFWFGEDYGERFYGMAVNADNIQACQSYEAWRNRKPLLWEKRRLCVGASFPWDGRMVTVTSFQDPIAIIACAYKAKEDPLSRNTVEKRYTITAAELAKAEKARRDKDLAAKDVAKVQERLRQCRLDLPASLIAKWTPEERVAATEWADLAKHDAGKTRVRPPAPPPHLSAAQQAADAAHAEEVREERKERIKRWRVEIERRQDWIAEAEKQA